MVGGDIKRKKKVAVGESLVLRHSGCIVVLTEDGEVGAVYTSIRTFEVLPRSLGDILRPRWLSG